MRVPVKIFVTFLFAYLLLFSSVNAQSKLYVNTSMQMTGSNFSDGSNHNSFFLNGGLTYQARNLYLSLSLPIVLSPNNTFTQLGNTFLPNNNEDGNNSDNYFNRFGHMNDEDGDMMGIANLGIGDLYLNSSLQIIDEGRILPSFSIDGYVKFPTASSNVGIGSGEYDFQVAMGVRKYVKSISFFAQFGYLFLGKQNLSSILNPFTFSFGMGYTFANQKHSFLLGYDSYSTIFTGAASPKQLSFGYNFLIKNGMYLSAIASAGLNSSTSNYTFLTGLNFEI